MLLFAGASLAAVAVMYSRVLFVELSNLLITVAVIAVSFSAAPAEAPKNNSYSFKELIFVGMFVKIFPSALTAFFVYPIKAGMAVATGITESGGAGISFT